MNRHEIVEEYLKLDETDQAYVRRVMLAGIKDDEAPVLTPEEEEEIVRRGEEAERHPENLLTWDEVKAMIQEQRSRNVR